jgi:hypothetical protein
VRKQPSYRLALLTAALLCGGTSVGKPTSGSFPGSAPLSDPTGRWIIEWREATETLAHALLLRDNETGRLSRLLEFERSVDVAWSPDGAALSVTDHAASNESLLSVYWPSRPGVVLRVDELLTARGGEMPERIKNGHRYFKAASWLRPKLLRLSVVTYDDEPGREYRRLFDVDIDSRAVREAHD